MLKIEDLKVGDELECIDEDYAFKNLGNKIDPELIVSHVCDDVFSIGACLFNSSDIKYFKKKEKSQQYTFDDLIDALAQAVKDKVLFGFLEHTDGCVQALVLNDDNISLDRVDIDRSISVIKSLYKETFVIECEEDIARIKIDADVTLANGLSAKCVSCQTRDFDRTVRLDCKSADDIFGIFVLKGAKVEQAKG